MIRKRKKYILPTSNVTELRKMEHVFYSKQSFRKLSFSAVAWIKHQLTSDVKPICCRNKVNPEWASEFGLAEDALILQCDESGFGGMSAGWIELKTRYRAKRESQKKRLCLRTREEYCTVDFPTPVSEFRRHMCENKMRHEMLFQTKCTQTLRF